MNLKKTKKSKHFSIMKRKQQEIEKQIYENEKYENKFNYQALNLSHNQFIFLS